ncbi:IS5 family transposase, partial [Natronospirillum operosum]
RKRIGEEGAEQLLKLSIDAGLKTGTIKPESFKTAVIDTTVMEKAIAHPSDSKLLQKSRERLVALARKQGVKLRQTYAKEFRDLSYKASRYAHARQMNRLKRTNQTMATRVGRLIRELLNKVPVEEVADDFLDILTRSSTAIRQAIDPGMRTAEKLFAFHAPEVECIRKGKARKPNEFGCKVSVMTTAEEGFVLCSHAMHGNPYDGHTVNRSLLKMHSVTGTLPSAVLADRGYRGADRNCLFSQVHITGRKRGKGKAHALQHRRNSIEPIIGHMKNDGLMHRNWLKGEMGDKINAVLCGAGQNLRMVLRKLRELLCAWIIWPLSAVITEIIRPIRLMLERQEMMVA